LKNQLKEKIISKNILEKLLKRLKLLLLSSLLGMPLATNALNVGMGIHPQDFPQAPENLTKLLKKYEISTFRTDYPWSQVEKQKGIYNPVNDKIEKTIKLAKENNIKPLIIFDYGNELYEKRTNLNPTRKPTSDTSVRAFVNYVEWSTNHLKNNVSTFEIWNEWIQMAGEGNRGTALSRESAKIYADLTIKSCRVIKKINPKAIVISGSSSPLSEESNQWLFAVINNGILNCVDGISLHAYNFDNNKKLDYKPIILSVKKLQLELAYINKGKEVPLYITETGVSNVKNATYTLEDTANYFDGYMKELSKLNYVKGVWWYDFINDGNNPNDKESNFGILNRDFSPKPIALKFADTIKKYK